MNSPDGFMPGRENRLILTVYADEAEAQPEDLTDKDLSCTAYDPRVPETAVARLIGNAAVVISAPETGVIELVFPKTTLDNATFSEMHYVVDDITNPATPKPFLPADSIAVIRAPSPTVPA